MAKISKSAQNNLVNTSLILFTLYVVTILISTIVPLLTIFFNPQSNGLNVIISLLSLTIGALLSMVLGYIIGRYYVRSKNKADSRFNGMIFGVFGFLVMVLISSSLPLTSWTSDWSTNVRLIFGALIPGLVTVALLMPVSKLTKKTKTVIGHSLFITILLVVLTMLPASNFLYYMIDRSSSFAYSLTMLILFALIGIVSYLSLNTSRVKAANRLAWSALSVAMFYAILFVVSSTVSSLWFLWQELEFDYTLPTVAVTLLGWVLYWAMQVRSFSK